LGGFIEQRGDIVQSFHPDIIARQAVLKHFAQIAHCPTDRRAIGAFRTRTQFGELGHRRINLFGAFSQMDRAGMGDRKEFSRALILRLLDQRHIGEQGQRRINHPRAWRIGPAGPVLNLADQIIAVARRFLDQLEQDEPQFTRIEHPASTAPLPAFPPTTPAMATVTQHRVQTPVGSPASHFFVKHHISFHDASKIYLKYVLSSGLRKDSIPPITHFMRSTMPDLFESSDHLPGDTAPLAERLRPRGLDEIVGQSHLTGAQGAIGRMVAAGKLASMILWGPPGTGKTTIARLLADAVGLRFEGVSAVFSGVADLKKVFAAARDHARSGQRTLLFVDEIHRFNRAQQDGFLPYVEDGTVTLVGATTENPSFELNAALLSRAQVLILHRLDAAALDELLARAEALEDRTLPLTADARAALIASADGDGRFLLNQAETLFSIAIPEPLDPAALSALLHRRMPVYDKDREGHYNLISALHKSLRGSDPQAALYYLARMLVAGEEPLYVLRRLVRFASEDVGLADPQALIQCLAAKDAYDFLGSPEGELAIVQACLYLATAPKSNAAYVAQKAAWKSAKETGSLMPPANILNAPTKLMKEIGYGKGYAYDHDRAEGFSGDNYWPEEMTAQTFYAPVERGFEAKIRERLAYWEGLRKNAGG
jgi:putative ATPase